MNDAASDIHPPHRDDDRQLTDAAVLAKTGKTWSEWFSILDAAGADQMDHRRIVAYLSRAHVVSPWWQQMVTVTYEQERVRRLKQSPMDDFQVSASKTVAAPVAAAYRSWVDPDRRRIWLDADLDISRAIPDRSLQVAFKAGTGTVDVDFHPRLDGTSQVALQHSGLPDAEAAESMRAFWARALDRLTALFAKE